METFKLISEHYSADSSVLIVVGENNGKYEVRDATNDEFNLLNTFDSYYGDGAFAFAEKEVS